MTPTNQPTSPGNEGRICKVHGLRMKYFAHGKPCCNPKVAKQCQQPAMPDNITPEPPANPLPVTGGLRDQIAEIVRGVGIDVYHCTRVWDAWNIGTMGQDDFEPFNESDSPEEIADAVIELIEKQSAPTPAPETKEGETPRVDAAYDNAAQWQERSLKAQLSGSRLDSDDPRPVNGWDTARTLERELTAMRVKLEEAEALALNIEADRDMVNMAHVEVVEAMAQLRTKLAASEAQCAAKDAALREMRDMPYENHRDDAERLRAKAALALLTPPSGNDLLAELERLRAEVKERGRTSVSLFDEAKKLQAQLTAAQQERDQALAEANRRDQKWMAGIEEITKCKINFDPGSEPTTNIPTLEQFIHRLQQERDELRRAAEAWSPIINEIDRRASKEHALEDNSDFTVTIEIDYYKRTATPTQQQEGGKA